MINLPEPMKPLRFLIFQVLILLFFCCSIFATAPRVGFYLPDSVNEMTLRYRTVNNLIILPVTINDSIEVNLILDTGCRNLVLFGKRFQKLLSHIPDKMVQFSGLGSGKSLQGVLSLTNKVSIQEVLGESIAVVIVGSRNLFSQYKDVDGVIGYDIFLRFEIELNPVQQTITFRPAQKANPPQDYHTVPLRINDARPVMDSRIALLNDNGPARRYELMIDTGSSLGVLLKTTNMEDFSDDQQKIIGRGFNGPVMGYNTLSKQLHLENLDMNNVPTGIIQSPWHNYASVGMAVLKKYIVVLNYCKSYASFKPIGV
jgi:hypothetical protein